MKRGIIIQSNYQLRKYFSEIILYMPQFGGKPVKKTKKTSSDSKRHFTVVIDRGVRGER